MTDEQVAAIMYTLRRMAVPQGAVVPPEATMAMVINDMKYARECVQAVRAKEAEVVDMKKVIVS